MAWYIGGWGAEEGFGVPLYNIAKGKSVMLYKYIKDHYKQAEPIFLSDLLRMNITEPDLNQQLKELCEKGLYLML